MRSDAQFAVMLGVGPDIVWYETSDPPRLGALVTVEAETKAEQQIGPSKVSVFSSPANQRLDPNALPVRVVSNRSAQLVKNAMRRPLLSYQIVGAGWLLERMQSGRGAILADDPGLGKTTQTVAAICAADRFPVVVVCPASLKLNWPKEFKHAANRVRVEVVDGRRGPLPKADVLVVNYGVLRAREAQLTALDPAVIVFDEAHELKEAEAPAKHRASVATRLARRAGCCIALTGSPLMNHPREFWRLLHIVDPKEWPSFDAFDLRYLRPPVDGRMSKRIVTKRGRVENVVELRVRTQEAMLRRRKDEVAHDLPKKFVKSIWVTLDPVDQAAYDAAEQDVVAWLRKIGQGRRASTAAKTLGLAKLSMLRRIASVGKLRRAVPAFLSSWFSVPKPSPLVVFGFHRSVLARVAQIAKGLGIRTVSILGSDDVTKRQKAVDEFQAGKADLFICPIRSGGVGINLQRASNSLFLERDWSPSLLRQAEDRTHRLGQTQSVNIMYLDARGTVDEHVTDILANKRKLIEKLIDGDSSDAGTQAVASSLFKRMVQKANQPGQVSVDKVASNTK